MHINVESLYCTPETNIIGQLYVNKKIIIMLLPIMNHNQNCLKNMVIVHDSELRLRMNLDCLDLSPDFTTFQL